MIPMRPKLGKFELKYEEMLGLNWYVLSGCTREEAFLKFVRPDFLGSKAQTAIRAAVQQFFATKNVQDYLDAYKKTIEELINPSPRKQEQSSVSMEERMASSKKKLVEFAMSLADNIEDAEDPEAVLKIADKIGLLDQDEQVEELPRRYLPVTCSNCEYRKFVEENCDIEPTGTDVEGKSNRTP
jgi:hypothetical protein